MMTIVKTTRPFIMHVSMAIAGSDKVISPFKLTFNVYRSRILIDQTYVIIMITNFRVVSTLINAGADVNARNYQLWTPIDCGAAYGQPKCVKILIEVRFMKIL